MLLQRSFLPSPSCAQRLGPTGFRSDPQGPRAFRRQGEPGPYMG